MRVNKISPKSEKTGFIVIGHPLNIKNLDLAEELRLSNSNIRRGDKAKSLRRKLMENYRGMNNLNTPKENVPQSQLCNVYYTLTKLAALHRLQNQTCSKIFNARVEDNW